MELNIQELLREYSEQESKHEEAVYDDEICAELDYNTDKALTECCKTILCCGLCCGI